MESKKHEKKGHRETSYSSYSSFPHPRVIPHPSLAFAPSMVNTFTQFCLVSGELLSNTFSVKISSSESVSDLKKRIKAEKVNAFKNIDANDLTLWRVSILVDGNSEDRIITLDSLDDKTKLSNPKKCLSKLFPEDPDVSRSLQTDG